MTEFRINVTSNNNFPLFINSKIDKDVFKDVLVNKAKIEAIKSMDDLCAYIVDYLECPKDFLLEMFMKRVTFDQVQTIQVNYRFEEETYFEMGKITYDVVKDIYTSTLSREDKVQEVEGIFGDEGLEDWPDSWFNVEFENTMIDKFIDMFKVEMIKPKYKLNAIDYDHKCPFYGVTNKDNLTKTIISYFATYTDNHDFIQCLVQNRIFIKNSFKVLKGSYAYLDPEDQDLSVGAEFELINNEIIYDHRECVGGW